MVRLQGDGLKHLKKKNQGTRNKCWEALTECQGYFTGNSPSIKAAKGSCVFSSFVLSLPRLFHFYAMLVLSAYANGKQITCCGQIQM